jgi:hypothetical protein
VSTPTVCICGGHLSKGVWVTWQLTCVMCHRKYYTIPSSTIGAVAMELHTDTLYGCDRDQHLVKIGPHALEVGKP